MSQIPFISEKEVLDLLTWDTTFEAVECSMKEVARNNISQPTRTIVNTGNTKLYSMPGALQNNKYGSLACKLIGVNQENSQRNPPLPSLDGVIVYFCSETGALKALMGAKEITKWRTAAASAVATKHIYLNNHKPCHTLAILGAGEQGIIHAQCFQHFFKFQKVIMWNRNSEKADKAVELLNKSFNTNIFKSATTVRECIEGADVIVTATNAAQPIVEFDWVKEGAFINAVGTGGSHCDELESKIYLNSDVYIDHEEGANSELKALTARGVPFKATVGSVICNGSPELKKRFTIFQSLGMSVEDCAMARLVYDLYNNNKV